MASIFTKIINGEIPCYKVAEDSYNLAFLDIAPLKKGHVLVVPKQEVDHLFDLPLDSYTSLQQFARKVAKAMKRVLPCERIGVAVIGLEVPHAHIHLIPINTMSDMDFGQPKLRILPNDMEEVASSIQEAMNH